MLLLFVRQAIAACVVSTTTAPETITFEIAVDGSCPTLSVVPDRPATLSAWTVQDGFRRKLAKDAVAEHPWLMPGLGWRINAPTLGPGDQLVLTVSWDTPNPDGPHVDVLLDGSAPRLARGGTSDQVWTLETDAKRGRYAFVDPKFGAWRRASRWAFGPEGEAGWLDGVAESGSAWWPGGEGTVTTTSVQRPARALIVGDFPPGSLSLVAPAATVDPATEFVGGQRIAVRVLSLGDQPILPDDTAFVAGLDAHFRAVSLPEPSVPLRLRGNLDKAEVLQALWTAVREPARGELGPIGRPRMLNRAWRSDWLTDEERALVFLRFLGQEKVPARWVLTGEQADPATLSGYDTLLIATQVGASVVWFDPACVSCGFGEVRLGLSGRPAVGGAEAVVKLPGRLELSVSLGNLGVQTEVLATGKAAEWLIAGGQDALAHRLGIVGSVSLEVRRWDTEVSVTITSQSAPKPVSLPQFSGSDP